MTVFPRVFYAHVAALETDSVVVVQGRVDMTGEEVKLLADEIWRMEDYRTSFYLIPPADADRGTLWAQMQEIFSRHTGDHPVYVQRDGHWRRLDASHWIDGSPEVCRQLSTLMGERGLKVR